MRLYLIGESGDETLHDELHLSLRTATTPHAKYDTILYNMKRYFLLFGSLYFIVFLPLAAKGQIEEEDVPHGQWSAVIFGSFQYSISGSMQGNIVQYENALAAGSTPKQYPFGARPFSGGFGVQIERRFEKSAFSYYFGASGSSFNVGYGFRNSPGGRFTMSILSSDLGIEYTLGQTYQTWNFYGRVGIVPSIITGSNRSGAGGNRFTYDSLRSNSTDSRFGMELEIGERYHFPRLPIGIEASINYTDVNVFGKSYIAPVSYGALFGGTGSINDAKNPNNPNDNPRVIDYFSFRFGGRFYF